MPANSCIKFNNKNELIIYDVEHATFLNGKLLNIYLFCGTFKILSQSLVNIRIRCLEFLESALKVMFVHYIRGTLEQSKLWAWRNIRFWDGQKNLMWFIYAATSWLSYIFKGPAVKHVTKVWFVFS